MDTYIAVKTAFSMFGTFMKDTAEIIGWEKVLELREKKGYQNGEAVVAFFKSHNPETRLIEFAAMNEEWYNRSGWNIETKASETECISTVHTCPMFDGYLESGLSVEQANNICKALHRGIDKRVKVDFPDGSFTSQVKKSKEDSCIEKYTIPT